jgi:predicted HTH transcriptional regulator
VETYPLPEEALREAVLNAVMHKDYGCAAARKAFVRAV